MTASPRQDGLPAGVPLRSPKVAGQGFLAWRPGVAPRVPRGPTVACGSEPGGTVPAGVRARSPMVAGCGDRAGEQKWSLEDTIDAWEVAQAEGQTAGREGLCHPASESEAP